MSLTVTAFVSPLSSRKMLSPSLHQLSLQYTDLQINYNFNMVAIDNFTISSGYSVPLCLAISPTVVKWFWRVPALTRKRLEKCLHIVEGLIQWFRFDEVIALIRASENKADAKKTSRSAMSQAEEQAELLYRDLTTLPFDQYRRGCLGRRRSRIAKNCHACGYHRWWTNHVQSYEERTVRSRRNLIPRLEYFGRYSKSNRLIHSLIAEEDTYVSVTKAGYIKRTQPTFLCSIHLKKFGKRGWWSFTLFNLPRQRNTSDVHNLWNVIYRPIHELADIRWKITESIWARPLQTLKLTKSFMQK